MIMSDLQDIFNAHLRRNPEDKGRIGFAGFKKLKPWYAIFGDRLTCLCKPCENADCYLNALHLVADYLAPLVAAQAGEDDASDDEEGDGGATNAAGQSRESPLARLVRVCRHRSKHEFCNEFVCGFSLGQAERKCYKCECSECGFAQLWSKGRRLAGLAKPGIVILKIKVYIAFFRLYSLPDCQQLLCSRCFTIPLVLFLSLLNLFTSYLFIDIRVLFCSCFNVTDHHASWRA